MRKLRLTKVLIVLLVAGLTFTAAGAAYAQVSQQYDLGCWGVLSAGGGTHTSSGYVVKDIVGQMAAGTSSNSSYLIRAGYTQDWRTIGHNTGGTTPPVVNPAEDNFLFLPYVARMIKIARSCPW